MIDPKFPYYDLSKVPQEKQPHVRALHYNLHTLSKGPTHFAAVLSLWKHVDQVASSISMEQFQADPARLVKIIQKDPQAFMQQMLWRGIVLRGGALELFHVGSAFEGLNHNLGKLPELRANLPGKMFAEARKAFLADFPSWRLLRHAIGHEGDKGATGEEFLSHAIERPEMSLEERFSLDGWSVQGNRFCATYQGKEHSYELSAASLAKLQAHSTGAKAAFELAASRMMSAGQS